MLRALRARLTYANVVSTIALFGVLATGSAYAANTIFSTDIVDGEVKTADLAATAVTNNKLAGNSVASGKVQDNTLAGADVQDNALGGADVQDNALGGADIADTGSLGTLEINEGSLFNDNSLTGGDVADTGSLGTLEINEGSLFNDNSLTGSDINESQLGQVPDAGAVDGIDSTQIATAAGDNADSGQCSGSLGILDETCANVTLTLPHPGRVVVDAVGSWQMLDGPAVANCYVRADSDSLGQPNFSPLMTVADHGSIDVNDPVSVQLVTTVLPAGPHTFDFRCNTESGASTSDIDGAYISAVLVGSG